MTSVDIDVGVVETDIEVTPVSAEMTVSPTLADVDVTVADPIQVDVSPPATVDLDFNLAENTVTVSPPPEVIFKLGGVDGKDGDPGPPGEPGEPGVSNAVYTGIWRWTSKTTDAGIAGQIGTDNAGWDGAEVHVSKQRSDNVDVSVRLASLTPGNDFRIQHKTDPTRYADYTINSELVDQGTWVSYSVTMTNSSGTVPNNNTEVLVILRVQGEVGAGNRTYHTPYDTLPPVGSLVKGDLLIEGENNNATWRWDGTQWVDVHNLNFDITRDAMQENANDIILLNQRLSELTVALDDTEKTSNTADGRIAMSDFEPTPDDVLLPVIVTDPATGELSVTYVPRIEGSIWYQRTRPRQNLCTNPSVEKDLTGWRGVNAVLTRLEPPDTSSVAGKYSMLMTNTASTSCSVEPTYNVLADEGEWYAASLHAMLVTGVGLGTFVALSFFDITDNPLLTITSEFADLVQELPNPDNWDRLNVVAQAPAGTHYLQFAFFNPNPNDVTYLDACIIENLDELGKYFDGDSFDGFWEGGTGNPLENPDDNPVQGDPGWQESSSRLYGNKILGIWELHGGVWVRKFLTEDTLDQIDARKITNLEDLFLADNSITTNKQNVSLLLASESMTKGSIVNIYDAGEGLFRVRLACAAVDCCYEASGFILDDVEPGYAVRVYTTGTDPYLTAMLPGETWLSLTPGAVQDTPPKSVGTLVQRVGFAADSFVLNIALGSPIRIT